MKKLFLKIIRLLLPENKMSDPRQELETSRKIIGKIHSNTIRATWYSALYERVALKEDGDIGKAFGSSYEAWGLEYSSEALLDALVMALMRIIYGDKENTASLLNLMTILKNKEVFKLLEEENKEDGRKLSYGLDELHKKVNDIKGDHRLKQINTHRNTNVAHQVIEHDPEKHKMPKYEDPSQLLEKIIPVVILCKNLLRDPSSNDPDYEKQMDAEARMAKETANEFWEYAAHLRDTLSRPEE